jgi:hypothetical protein
MTVSLRGALVLSISCHSSWSECSLLRRDAFLGDPCHYTVDNLAPDDILTPDGAGERLHSQLSINVSAAPQGTLDLPDRQKVSAHIDPVKVDEDRRQQFLLVRTDQMSVQSHSLLASPKPSSPR